MTSDVDRSETNTATAHPLPTKVVRFEVQSEDNQTSRPASRRLSRIRAKRLKEPSPMPRRVYGLYVPDDQCIMLGLRMASRTYPPVLSDNDRNRLLYMGIRCANMHCTEKFPDIPLRWRTCIYVICEEGMQPLVVLGHRNSPMDEKIYVTDEQVEELRSYLQLGNQQPAWYRIDHVYGRWYAFA